MWFQHRKTPFGHFAMFHHIFGQLRCACSLTIPNVKRICRTAESGVSAAREESNSVAFRIPYKTAVINNFPRTIVSYKLLKTANTETVTLILNTASRLMVRASLFAVTRCRINC